MLKNTLGEPPSFHTSHRLGRRELGDRLGPFTHRMLGQLPRQHQPHRRLNLPGRQGLRLVNLRELAYGVSGMRKNILGYFSSNILQYVYIAIFLVEIIDFRIQ